jgi:hypothetical protein
MKMIMTTKTKKYDDYKNDRALRRECCKDGGSVRGGCGKHLYSGSTETQVLSEIYAHPVILRNTVGYYFE